MDFDDLILQAKRFASSYVGASAIDSILSIKKELR